MTPALWTVLLYLAAVLALMAVAILRDRRRTPDAGEGPTSDSKAWYDMLIVEGRCGNPSTGGDVLPQLRPRPLPRGRHRH